MDIVEGIAIIILILAVLCLVYYYLQNYKGFNPSSEGIKNLFASSHSIEEEELYPSTKSSKIKIEPDLDKSEEKVSTVDKIKISFKDIDMAAALNTDVFSKRLDAFLDEKSEELIENWSLATTNDLKSLEDKYEKACNNIDDLEKRFREYGNITDSKIEDLDKRLKALERD